MVSVVRTTYLAGSWLDWTPVISREPDSTGGLMFGSAAPAPAVDWRTSCSGDFHHPFLETDAIVDISVDVPVFDCCVDVGRRK